MSGRDRALRWRVGQDCRPASLLAAQAQYARVVRRSLLRAYQRHAHAAPQSDTFGDVPKSNAQHG